MVKQCPVILNNDAVTVVRFENTEVQFPSIHKDAKTVFVKLEGGRYVIVDKMEDEKPNVSFMRYSKKENKVENNKAEDLVEVEQVDIPDAE